MKPILSLSLVLFIGFYLCTNAYGQTQTMALIEAGSYTPIYGRDATIVKVKNFFMDIYPVTNQQYLQFVKENTKWRKSKVKKLFADGNYLTNWKNDTTLNSKMQMQSPVTNVSWFAANAYCQCQGKRLPTIDEWEYVAMANQKMADARRLKSYNQYILNWYEAPKTYANLIGQTFKNYWGVYDLHGLVWEWNADFNSVSATLNLPPGWRLWCRGCGREWRCHRPAPRHCRTSPGCPSSAPSSASGPSGRGKASVASALALNSAWRASARSGFSRSTASRAISP